MTEEEAKTKRCCGPPAVAEATAWAADAALEMPTFCIASACMAFRWLPDATIVLGKGRVATVSAEDAGFEAGGYWWSGRYAKNELGYLHRHIAETMWGDLPTGMFVDHIDGDPLNCRRGNLRLVTPSQNAANAAARGGKSRHRGVFAARGGRWAAQISKAGARLHLGTFDTEAQAAEAYDRAAADIHGEFARKNLSPRRDRGRAGYCGLAGQPQ